MEPQAVQRWIRGRRRAQERERVERLARPASPASSFALALSLISLNFGVDRWPVVDSERDRLDDRRGYERWSRLRKTLGAR